MSTNFEAAAIIREKTEQAVGALQEQKIDLWITFVRETTHVKDPMIDLLVGFHLTWPSALMIHRNGERVAIVGRYDVPNMKRLGAYSRVVGYDQSIQPLLLEEIQRWNPRKIAINYSESDPAADGLSYGMFRLLSRMLAATPYGSRLISAEQLIAALRGRKTRSEIALIEAAVVYTEDMLQAVTHLLRPGTSDLDIANFLHQSMDEQGFGSSWEREYCPVVTVGPESAVGHAMPSGLKIKPGRLVQIDFGISRHGFVSDLQRTWYVPEREGADVPEEIQRAWEATTAALEAGRAALKPGVRGWEVDAAARSTLVAAGYPEYLHAFGHHIGRSAHDGATILGPKWERYGDAIDRVIEPGNVFAIELGVSVPGRGYIGREENVVVTEHGADYLSHPQQELWIA